MSEGAEIVVITQFSSREKRGIYFVETFFCQDARWTLRLESSVKSSYLVVVEASLVGEREDTAWSVSAGTDNC